jgi:hypothetical protein
MNLWRGFALDIRPYIAFIDEILDEPLFKGGTADLSQVIKLGKKNWITPSVGYFAKGRWRNCP